MCGYTSDVEGVGRIGMCTINGSSGEKDKLSWAAMQEGSSEFSLIYNYGYWVEKPKKT